jgi:UDP-N-acetylglucosamine--dolichyl-phosphate N-acetylglucosaminephosphotransferase
MARQKSARSKSPAGPAPPSAVSGPASAPPVALVLAGAVLVAAVASNYCNADTSFCGTAAVPLVASVIFAGIACAANLLLIPATRELFIKAGLFGIDLNKSTTARDADGELKRPVQGVKVPEPMGLVTGTIYLMVMFIFIPFVFVNVSDRPQSLDAAEAEAVARVEWNHVKLTEFITGLLSITCMLFLGFGDDVLDLKWRHKFILPSAAALPMLMVYASNHGVTDVAVPIMLQPWLGGHIDLGPLYYIFMGCLSIFCTNSINILAGVNGLEVGQCVVIALSMLANNIIQLVFFIDGSIEGNKERMWNNLFSIYILLPFLGVSIGLLYHNWFPSAVFVGDTYCYFAGMTFAVSGILGHNPKTLLLFHIPQVVNFVFSVPQLMNARAIPCPRHRMPAFVTETGEVCASYTVRCHSISVLIPTHAFLLTGCLVRL